MTKNIIVFQFVILFLLTFTIKNSFANKLLQQKEIDFHNNDNIELIVLIDDSQSMKKNDVYNLRLYTLYYLSDILATKKIPFSLVKFGGTSQTIFSGTLSSDQKKEEFHQSLSKLTSSESFTDYTEALMKSLELLKQSQKEKKNIIIITDGKLDPNPDHSLYKHSANIKKKCEEILENKVLQKSKEHQIQLNVINLSRDEVQSPLKRISEKANGIFSSKHSAGSVNKSINKILDNSKEETIRKNHSLMLDIGLGNLLSLYYTFRIFGKHHIGLGSGYLYYQDAETRTEINVVNPSIIWYITVKKILVIRNRVGMDFIEKKGEGYKRTGYMITPDVLINVIRFRSSSLYAGAGMAFVFGREGMELDTVIGTGYKFNF